MDRDQRLPVSGFVTSDYETATLIRLADSHGRAVEFLDSVLSSKIIKLVYVNAEAFASAVALFKERRDKAWSFTDCTSFSIMRALGIRDCFAFDRNFEEAGFSSLSNS